jgi:hypothetical protein
MQNIMKCPVCISHSAAITRICCNIYRTSNSKIHCIKNTVTVASLRNYTAFYVTKQHRADPSKRGAHCDNCGGSLKLLCRAKKNNVLV